MAHTDISIKNDGGKLVPSISSVPVSEGDSISFSTADGRGAFLFFSPDALEVLSPPPSGPVPVGAGGKTTFTFTSSDEGAYSVFFEPNANSGPKHFPVQGSSSLHLQIDGWGHFGGPITNINTSGVVTPDTQ